MSKYKNLDLFSIIKNTQINTPVFLDKVSAGFPSPATDYMENKLDLNEYLIKHPAATFIVKANGSSMIDADIYSGDLLIVDRSLTPRNNNIVIASIFGDAGMHTRAAVSTNSLPLGVSVEVDAIFELK